jgi:alpha-ribazole phosphatase
VQLFLIRHPQPQVPANTCYGRTDLPLAQDAEHCAAALRALLPENAPLYTSPLTRCRQLAERLHPAPIADDRLLELDFGDWEMRTWDEIGAAGLDAWAAAPQDFVFPAGESVRSLRRRVTHFLDDLRCVPPPAAVVVTHAGVLRACAAELLGLPDAEWLSMRFAYGKANLIHGGRLQFQDLPE